MIERTIPEDFVDLANVQAAHESQLLARQNVVGVALGTKYVGGQDTGDRALTVLVERKMPGELLSEDDRVPGELDGMTTDVQEVGVIQAGGGPVLDAIDPAAAATQEVGPFTLRQRARPAFGGLSIGHFQITAGTLSTCCYDLNPFPSVPGRYYVLSNNHVLANSNNANIGDPILQPGPFDGGTIPNDVIARLTRFVPIRFIAGGQAPCNFVDCAIAEGRFEDLDRRIYWVGDVKRIFVAPTVGMVVEKCGRTTNFTTGTVTNINATVDVNYGGGQVARFCNQIITSNMSAGGDSGSLVCDLDEGAVGLLFAGSSQITILNNIALVQVLLGIRITER